MIGRSTLKFAFSFGALLVLLQPLGAPAPAWAQTYVMEVATIVPRVLPLEMKGILAVAGALLPPFLPLYLTEFSVLDLLQRMADALV
jgi:hypothetical protein